MKNPQAYVEGHIPGAVYWPWKESLWDPTMREFVSPKGFSLLMEKSGATPDKEIVFYYRLSHRASMAWFAARCLLGYTRTKVYEVRGPSGEALSACPL